ncbi:serine/threonine-protein kinase [uncultured Roseibium sp.]|uniref:serine/threonine protein kinase n=1 Tax=uncultured Roseibium sp. TaxID=1936171 RepID=UPI002628163E|nr:serine/threonine-protein kinase [uncultured Roseibium sp.]
MNSDDHLLPIGTRLNNLYEIEEHIADGGIGIVYRARDIESGDPVAIKVLLATFAKDPMILDLFKREAKILRKLKHDALTQYYVFTKEPTLGVYYLAMEFVAGPSLKSRLEAGALEPEAVYRLLVRVASALQAVHDREVIHRDLSPDNIILQNGDVGQAKIIDFGISRANTGGPTIIGDGFAGKINYVSPEQVGLFDGKVTARSDIYSLGLVITEALTGKQTDMGGTQVEMIEKRRIVPSLDGVDNRFRPLLESMLQPDPANRPSSMGEIAEWTLGAPMYRPVAEKTVIRPSAPPPEQSALDQPPQPVRWGRRVLVALSLLGFAGLGAAGVYFLVGQTVPNVDQKPVLVAQPRENAPKTPVQNTSQGGGTTTQIDNNETGGGQSPRPVEPNGSDDQTSNLTQGGGNDTLPLPPDDSGDGSTTSPIEQATLKPEDRVRSFISNYKAGECMYLQPVQVAANSAEIEGFASRTPPFIAFDSDFTRQQGFEAKIQANLVSDSQCPAVAFLRATPQGNEKTELRLDMQRTVVPNGENMAGRISGFDPSTGELGLLFVSSNGKVINLSPYLQADDGGAGFVVPLNLKTLSEETGLIISMVGTNLVSNLAVRRETQADKYFDALMQDLPILRATATTVKVVP